jgi:hypothetical protein
LGVRLGSTFIAPAVSWRKSSPLSAADTREGTMRYPVFERPYETRQTESRLHAPKRERDMHFSYQYILAPPPYPYWRPSLPSPLLQRRNYPFLLLSFSLSSPPRSAAVSSPGGSPDFTCTLKKTRRHTWLEPLCLAAEAEPLRLPAALAAEVFTFRGFIPPLSRLCLLTATDPALLCIAYLTASLTFSPYS